MIYTQYLYPQDWVKEEVAAKHASIKLNVGPDADLLRFGLYCIANRLKKDPLRYRDYGPYWHAIKAAMRLIDINYGSNDDPMLREAYCGKSAVETLVMAEAFRDNYLNTFLRYNNKFVLDNSGSWTEIIDGDMEFHITD